MLQCPGVVLVHSDRTLTCSEAECELRGTGSSTMVLGHTMFVPCEAVAGRGPCPWCDQLDPAATIGRVAGSAD